MLITLFRLLALGPKEAAVAVGLLIGRPDLAAEMTVICTRESRCESVSIHPNDGKHAAAMYRNAVRVGWLDPERCFHHQVEGKLEMVRFGVRGSFGTAAAYTLWHLGGCLPPEVLDIPIFAALATAKRMQYQCKRYGACDEESRHRLWAGAKRYDRRKYEREPNC